jgi:hypothetical protein
MKPLDVIKARVAAIQKPATTGGIRGTIAQSPLFRVIAQKAKPAPVASRPAPIAARWGGKAAQVPRKTVAIDVAQPAVEEPRLFSIMPIPGTTVKTPDLRSGWGPPPSAPAAGTPAPSPAPWQEEGWAFEPPTNQQVSMEEPTITIPSNETAGAQPVTAPLTSSVTNVSQPTAAPVKKTMAPYALAAGGFLVGGPIGAVVGYFVGSMGGKKP